MRLPLVVLVFTAASASAQDLISSNNSGTLSVAQLSATIKAFDQAGAISAPTSSVSLRRVVYSSKDFNGKAAKLSGLVAWPTNGAPKGLVVYCHGTTADPRAVPSFYKGGKEPAETTLAVHAFASGGYAVALPDYLGLGINSGVHPYPLGSINAQSAIDIINPARLLAQRNNVAVGKALYVTGYSEGGAVAMWTSKLLQERAHPNYELTSSACLSGPYDLSGVMAKSLISNQSNPLWVAARLYLAAYCGYSIAHYYADVKLSDVFVPSFASYIPFLFQKNLTDKQYGEKFAAKGFQLGAVSSLKRTMQPDAVKAILDTDVTFPFMRVMASQDVTDWRPELPLYMVCLKQDYLVSPQNTYVAFQRMSANGAAAVGAHEMNIPKANHITAAAPATVLARQFFDGGFSAVPTSIGRTN